MAEVNPDESASGAGEKKTGKLLDPKDKKSKWILGGLALLVVVIIYMIHRGQEQNAAANTASSSTPSNIDPATGYPTGSPADLAALGQSGSVASTPSSSYPMGDTSTTTNNTTNNNTYTTTPGAVPNVKGMTIKQALAALSAAGYKGNVTTPNLARGTSYIIGSQTPYQTGALAGTVNLEAVKKTLCTTRAALSMSAYRSAGSRVLPCRLSTASSRVRP
jgi:hypothetical protein